jgi:hypothetical protein
MLSGRTGREGSIRQREGASTFGDKQAFGQTQAGLSVVACHRQGEVVN